MPSRRSNVPGAKPGEVVGAGELPGMGRPQPPRTSSAAQGRHECQRCGSDEWAWCDYRGCSDCFEPESELCDDRSNPFPDGPTDVEPAVETLKEQVRMGIYGGGAYQATAIKALNRLVALSKEAS